MSVCRVQNNDIDMCIYQLLCTIQNVCCDTKCSTAQQTAFGVFGRERILDLFFNILDRDQSFEIEVIIHDRQFLFSCFCKDLFCLFQCDTFFCSDEVFRSHGFFDLFAEILFKLQITVCDDTYQFSVFCNRHTGNTELCHQIVCFFQCIVRG